MEYAPIENDCVDAFGPRIRILNNGADRQWKWVLKQKTVYGCFQQMLQWRNGQLFRWHKDLS